MVPDFRNHSGTTEKQVTPLKDRLRRIISERAGGSIKRFAESIQAGKSTVQSWDSGNLPNGTFLERIHKKYAININWLLTGEGEPYIPESAEATKVSDELVAHLKRDENVIFKEITNDEFVNAIAGLKYIFDQNDQTLKSAILANIAAFTLTSTLNAQMKGVLKRLDNIEKVIESVIDQNKAPDGVERRKSFLDLKKIVNR